MSEFSDDIKIILQTVNENEYQAAVTFLEPPSDKFHRAVIFPSAGTVVGYFAGHKVALIQTGVGESASEYIQTAIYTFKNAKFIIGVGACYAFGRTMYKLGDVLVSKNIGDIHRQGGTIPVVDVLNSIFCRDLLFENDFEVAEEGRFSKVYAGTLASFALLVDNKEMRDSQGRCS